MKPYNNGTKRLKGQYGMISISPYICSDKDVEHLRNKGISGQELQERLESIGIISNKNAVPFDTENKMVTSGIRLGTPALTSRGMKQSEMIVIAKIIAQCADDFEKFTNAKIDLSYTVSGLAKTFPLYGN